MPITITVILTVTLSLLSDHCLCHRNLCTTHYALPTMHYPLCTPQPTLFVWLAKWLYVLEYAYACTVLVLFPWLGVVGGTPTLSKCKGPHLTQADAKCTLARKPIAAAWLLGGCQCGVGKSWRRAFQRRSKDRLGARQWRVVGMQEGASTSLVEQIKVWRKVWLTSHA